MSFSTFIRGTRWAALATVAGFARLAGPAHAAAVLWDVSANFSDGGTLTGTFYIDVYGYVHGYDLKTSANSPFGGFEFTTPNATNGYIGPMTTPTSLTLFGTSYKGDQLHLEFAKPLTTPVALNALLDISYECRDSWSCPASGEVRYLVTQTSAAAAVPETATWALLLIGFAGIGSSLRMARRKALAV